MTAPLTEFFPRCAALSWRTARGWAPHLREGLVMSEIIHKTPGTRGYRIGCRCPGCTAANTAKVAERRARKAREGAAGTNLRSVPPSSDSGPSAGRVAPPVDVERKAGPMEALVVAEIESLWDSALWDAECDSWEMQALDSARRIDDGATTTHIVALSRLRNEAMRELRNLLRRAVPASAVDDGEDDFLAGMRPLGIPLETPRGGW